MKDISNKLPAICGGKPEIRHPSPHFQWPIITDKTKKAVQKQLEESISIYNRSGIILKFEEKFASYHDSQFGLLSNSGTSAIFSMFEGINLKPGDEVIAPVYTFFATVSPIMYTGAKPIFCDCLDDGNIDPDDIRRKITKKTKAIIVTHMWGIPCDMDEIVSISREFGLRLLEDCSHAHGAEYYGKKVGTFGDASAWSLQGSKIISGGEGGIMLTNDSELYARAQLQGHYNKRSIQEIDSGYDLYEYAVTGIGQKFRAHPLAIAIALEQFEHLDHWLLQKREFADTIINELSTVKFLQMPVVGEGKKPSWYAFIMQIQDYRGIKREQLFRALCEEGMSELDIPKSTCPLNNLPLFLDPGKLIPRLYKGQVWEHGNFPRANRFYDSALKLPVWALKTDESVLVGYINSIKKISFALENNVGKILERLK